MAAAVAVLVAWSLTEPHGGSALHAAEPWVLRGGGVQRGPSASCVQPTCSWERGRCCESCTAAAAEEDAQWAGCGRTQVVCSHVVSDVLVGVAAARLGRYLGKAAVQLRVGTACQS